MILDGHIHIDKGEARYEDFIERLKESGIDGGLVISLPLYSFESKPSSPQERLDNLFEWTASDPDLYPFYWIDPLEKDALDQVERDIRDRLQHGQL